MKKFKKVATILLIIYLALSLAASLIHGLSDNIDVCRAIVFNRFGLLVGDIDAENKNFAILSPFNNYCDVFLLVVDWSEIDTSGLRIASDGFDAFGEWWY